MNLLSDNSLKVSDEGFDLAIRLPWYRALPLSTIDIKDVRIDGRTVVGGKMTLRVNGGEYALGKLADLTDEVWFVLDSAILHFEYPGAKRDREYDVEVATVLYPPYMPGFSFPNQAKERMRAS